MSARPLGSRVLSWTGRLPDHRRSWSDVSSLITTEFVTLPTLTGQGSPYRARFLQGAFLAPRALFWVVESTANPLGVGAGRTALQSDRRGQERKPWRDLADLSGNVESEFVRPAIQGEHVLPFRINGAGRVVSPEYAGSILLPSDDTLDSFPGLAEWWRQVCGLWAQNRPDTSTGDLAERANYKNGLLSQIKVSPERVVYAASGSRLTAARLTDPTIIVEKSAYWATAKTAAEGRYLTAILNSSYFDDLVEPYQSRGIGGSRHFDKVIFEVGLPLYDSLTPSHQALVAAAEAAEQVAAEVVFSSNCSQRAARGLVRAELQAKGLEERLDSSARDVILAG
jgi:hypothetical protein